LLEVARQTKRLSHGKAINIKFVDIPRLLQKALLLLLRPASGWPSHYLTTLLQGSLCHHAVINIHQHMSQQQRHAPYTCTGSISSPQIHPQQIQHLLHQATPACTTGKKAAAQDLSCDPAIINHLRTTHWQKCMHAQHTRNHTRSSLVCWGCSSIKHSSATPAQSALDIPSSFNHSTTLVAPHTTRRAIPQQTPIAATNNPSCCYNITRSTKPAVAAGLTKHQGAIHQRLPAKPHQIRQSHYDSNHALLKHHSPSNHHPANNSKVHMLQTNKPPSTGRSQNT